MQRSRIPFIQEQHLLKASGLLNCWQDERFERLTRLAKILFSVPVAQFGCVDQTSILPKSCDGSMSENTSREISFCAHTLLDSTPLIVRDAFEDIRFFDNSLVNQTPFIRFYAGCAVRLADGVSVGVLCLMDTQPRDFDECEIQLLKDLAEIAEDTLAIVHTAKTDMLTGLFNRRGFMERAQYAFIFTQRWQEPLSFVYITLDHFKVISNNFEHDAGNFALLMFAGLMTTSFREIDLLARQDNDQFIVMFIGSHKEGAFIAMEYLKEKVADFNKHSGKLWELAFSWGCVEYDPARHTSIEDVIAEADRLVYKKD